MRRWKTILVGAALALGQGLSATAQSVTLLDVSYDPTRELYRAVNAAFAQDYKARAGKDVAISMSHGGLGKQARGDRWLAGRRGDAGAGV